ncbi:hypothetical protein DEU56DRAFT_785542 [Suillus clintonianus]|uniref:uncharacterized protein n=1 Tax=Suillus clintonianus TaxID=1904413 RepID=UPI001B85B427|nr:uncharacterized protein DEU56DRAFT_785542 [Suillus clintonianus]KAG2146630.1 hypothetical protein DEU56DRAFT_785542 [Suillus clintonianus]
MNHLRQVLLSSRRPVRPTSLALLRCRRTFSFTSRLQASENEDAFLSQFKNTSIFGKLADKPEALMALRDFAELMRAQGIDANAPPSTLQMMRLAANSEFREAAQKVVTELQNAGVDLTSQDTIQELMGLSKKVGGN